MDIWIILDGEKTGPLHDFEIRRKIEDGELPADTPAWHEGLAAWTSLAKIDIFTREFERVSEIPKTPAPESRKAPAPARDNPPPIPEAPAPLRRFCARWFDLLMYSAVWWLLMWAIGRDITAILKNAWIILLHYVPWFVIETFLLHHFRTTPGKWLLGLTVVNDDGSALGLAEATQRSMRVLFVGLGFGWLPLALVCQGLSFATIRRLGRPLWDHAAGHRVVSTPLHPFRLVGYVFGLSAAIILQVAIVFPPALEEEIRTNPDFKRQWDEFQEQLRKSGNPPPGES